MQSILLLALAVGGLAQKTDQFRLPPLQYSAQYSFRGVDSTGKVPNFDISGHAQALPGVHDFLRLVPPSPLAHGSIFTSKPFTGDEFVVEIAFRMHGPALTTLLEHDEEEIKMKGKGGRGLAFWYTKTGQNQPITISNDPSKPNAPVPGPFPDIKDDPKVSLFGYSSPFDGLGVIFDSSSTIPVLRRSDPQGLDAMGAEISGVVSGIMDDGSKDWLDVSGKPHTGAKGTEALYLGSAIGECEAAFRNGNGLLWARISNYNNTLRCDLDLAPHTTLSKIGRDFAHNCWTIEGVKLDAGSYFGISGMASGNTEPDSIDVYALDVFEIAKEGAKEVPLPFQDDASPLEGTSDDAEMSFAHEIFLSQARMMEAIDALGRRVDALATSVGSSAGHPPPAGSGSAAFDDRGIMARLSSIDGQLAQVIAKTPATSPEGDVPSFTHVVQLQERLMAELKAFGRKIDSTNGQSLASLATLSSRSAESLNLLQRATASIEATTLNQSSSGPWIYILFIVIAGLGLFFFYKRREGFRGGKKMI